MANEADTEAGAELVHDAATAHESNGLPQLDFSTWDNQIFWLVVAIVLLFFLMSRLALPRIASVIEDRADTIADDLDRAADFRKRAEEAELAYEIALREARSEAQKIAAEAGAKVQKELDAAIARADAEIAARAAESERRINEVRAGAAESVGQVAGETAEAIVEALMPGAVDKDAVAAAVRGRMG